MSRTAAQWRKAIREGGAVSAAIAGLLYGLSGVMWQHEYHKELVSNVSITAVIITGLGILCILFGIAFPRDPRDERHICRIASTNECGRVRDFTVAHVGDTIPSEQVLQALLAVNPNLVYVIERICTVGVRTAELVGCFSIIPIKQGAVRRLEDGDVAGYGIKPEHIAKKNGSPRGLYIGVIAGKDLRARGAAVKYLSGELDRICKKYGITKVFGRPVTENGLRLMKKHNFLTAVDNSRPRMNFVCYRLWKA